MAVKSLPVHLMDAFIFPNTSENQSLHVAAKVWSQAFHHIYRQAAQTGGQSRTEPTPDPRQSRARVAPELADISLATWTAIAVSSSVNGLVTAVSKTDDWETHSDLLF